jgi:hypothetical protein
MHGVTNITFVSGTDAMWPYTVLDNTNAYAKQGGPDPPLPAATRVQRGVAVTPNYDQIVIVRRSFAP